MDILVTLPPHIASYVRKHKKDFPGITDVFSDPVNKKLGSAGGTVNVLWKYGVVPGLPPKPGCETCVRPKRIIIHSDGESRRLPAYAPVGKSFIPFPVFKWGKGQRIDQTLFDVQRPLLEKILEKAPEGLNTLVASGDALVWMDAFLESIPEADVVCVGVWTRPEVAVRHGVFICPRHDPASLNHMLQKPSLETLQSLTEEFLYLLDAGIWLLSDRAVACLFQASGWDVEKQAFRNNIPDYHDLYAEFGRTLGTIYAPTQQLTVRILPLRQAEFYHFGSNADLLQSTSLLHNRVTDQREIWHKKIKPSPDIFVQNSVTGINFNAGHSHLWIESSCVSSGWQLHDHHILTGIPENTWNLDLQAGICLDFIPIGQGKWCIRPYGFNDTFKGNVKDQGTTWENQPMINWFQVRAFRDSELKPFSTGDIYDCPIFPVMDEPYITQEFIQWLISGAENSLNVTTGLQHNETWLRALRYSAREIINNVNLLSLAAQRRKEMKRSLLALATNYRQSIFYQLDLQQTAEEFVKAKLPLPQRPGSNESIMTRIHYLMFCASWHDKQSKKNTGEFKKQAFDLLKEGMLENIRDCKLNPVLNVQCDQILWGRSPLRLDLAGGWTDTPPYCILYGGRVVNMAVELNGQPPIQVYIRPSDQPVIAIHSIDLGLTEVVKSYEDISAHNRVGSAFSIPKAALMLAGFHPEYSAYSHKNLKEQLKDFGGGFDITLMVAVPKGSGLGTSSILAATVLGGLSEFCALGWDRQEVAFRTLLLEQLLTTGGGWQDQLGGVFEGVKLIESMPGLVQKPLLRWAPDHLFTRNDTSSLILLYYTGITRVAKHILTDIVEGMFLNSAKHLSILSEMKQHALNTYEAIQNNDWEGLTAAIRYSWELNQKLDSGTNTPEIAAILHSIKDYLISCKLLGAGGGGYLMIYARDEPAASRIRAILRQHPPNSRARFVDWRLSETGLELTKS